MLKRTAEIQEQTVTDFMVAAIQEPTQRFINQAEIIRLSLADQQCFAETLLAPPQPAPALDRTFACRRKLVAPE